MHKLLLLGFLFFNGYLILAQESDEITFSESQKSILQNIVREDYQKYLHYLASDELQGRGSGTKGEQLAGEYIANHFKEQGLAPAGENGTYFQTFDVTVGHDYYPDNRFKMNYKGVLSEFKIREDYAPFSFSGDGEASSELVFAGYGITYPEIKYDDYEGLDVKGKILLILRREPTDAEGKSLFAAKGKEWSRHAEFASKAQNAQSHGAAGLIILNDPVTIKRDGDHLMPMAGFGGKQDIPCIHLKASVGDAIFMALGLKIEEIQQEINTSLKPKSFPLTEMNVNLKAGLFKLKRQARNVLAYLEGTDPALQKEYLVIGAHYDHLGTGDQGGSLAMNSTGQIHNGADDNASGTSGILALAKALSQIKERKRSLLLMTFSGEEMGLLGSQYYTDHPTLPLENCVAMINLDMIGRMNNHQLQIGGIGTCATFEEELRKLNEFFQFKLSLNKAGRGPSDHTSFYVKNIPVLFFFTGLHLDYHRPSDDSDKINYEGAEKITEMVGFKALNFLNRETRPVFQKSSEPTPQEGEVRRSRVRLGIMPNYSDEEKGVLISDVSEGGSAQKAGMKGGDRIIRMDERQINNIYEMMNVLADANPNDIMKITVVRDGQEVILTVILMAPR